MNDKYIIPKRDRGWRRDNDKRHALKAAVKRDRAERARTERRDGKRR